MTALAAHPYPPTAPQFRPRPPHLVRPGDQCDHSACPADAKVRVFTPRGPLGFCLHHMSALTPVLLAAGYQAQYVFAR